MTVLSSRQRKPSGFYLPERVLHIFRFHLENNTQLLIHIVVFKWLTLTVSPVFRPNSATHRGDKKRWWNAWPDGQCYHDRGDEMLIKYNKRPDSDAAGHNEQNHLPAWATRFVREEDGTVTILAFFIAVTFLIMGGITIDAMRHEMERSSLQATLDGAVLTAASAKNKSEARSAIEDYVTKHGKIDYLSPEQDGEITAMLDNASITARGQNTLETYLLKMSGVKTLSVAASSTAEVNIPKLEGILVLDLSATMKGNKLANLQKGAHEFVEFSLDGRTPGSVVLSIVPFSSSVSPPESIYNALAVDDRHDYTTCLEFKDNDYTHATLTSGSSSLSSGIPASQMVYTSLSGGFGADSLDLNQQSCFNEDAMRILPYSISAGELYAKIDGLDGKVDGSYGSIPDPILDGLGAAGDSSGNDGMNWGAALLDPTFRQVTSSMIDAGSLTPSLANVPVDYDDPNTNKVIIFMSDGVNTPTTKFDLDPPKFRGTASNLYEVVSTTNKVDYAFNIKNVNETKTGTDAESVCAHPKWECVYEGDGAQESVYFLYSPIAGEYYSIGAAAMGNPKWYTPSEFNNLSQTMPGYIETIQLDWEDAWGLMSPDYYGEITGDWSAWNDYYSEENITAAHKNTLMQSVCSATKTEGVIVYTIGFEVNDAAERELIKCATSESHYYHATGGSIITAFGSIAANIRNLRLSQ
ncbi:Tad domain-containing protein [Roseovarius gaetbuli]|nr:Tad domain-containing protein [Roseovarius gaetbuli]